MANYDRQWAMLRVADAARRALSRDTPALEALDVALFNVLDMKLTARRRFEKLRMAILPARAALEAWRMPRPARPEPASSPPMRGRRILFCVWSDSHVKHLAPVARVLVASGQASPMFLVFRDPQLVPLLQQQSLPAAWIGAGLSRRARLSGVAEFARRVPTALRVARELGAGFDAQRGTNADRVRADAMLFALAGVAPLELATRRFLANFSPLALVFANHEMPVGRMLARVADAGDIPLVYVQHGLIPRHPKHAWPHTGDTCVWGAQTKKLLESLGWDGSRMFVCGAPGFDGLNLLKRSPEQPKSGRHVVLFTPVSGNSLTPAVEVERATYALYSALARRADVELIVKPHPVDRLKIAQGMLGRFPSLRATVVPDGDLHRLMLSADAVATMWSATALEAVLLEKPVVIVDSGTDDPLPIVEYGAAIKAGEPDAVAAALESVFRRSSVDTLAPGRARFTQEFASGNDGQAAERTAAVVLRASMRSRFPSRKLLGQALTIGQEEPL
jgi:hypothetical protein